MSLRKLKRRCCDLFEMRFQFLVVFFSGCFFLVNVKFVSVSLYLLNHVKLFCFKSAESLIQHTDAHSEPLQWRRKCKYFIIWIRIDKNDPEIDL